MRIRNKQDFWAGVMFIAIGGAFAGFAQQYEFGSGSRMGPGYFPTLLGVLLLVLGIIVSWASTGHSQPETHIAKIGWRELILILGAVALFGITLSSLGMVVAVALMVLVSALANYEFKLKETLVLIVVLLIMSYLLFVVALELQFPVWPTFLTA
ncbi:MAG TPA: tripartite tricarboxylate transporter TctB family protein [Burkholderiaceae bacterium]|mgnify:CR=1 FL=1|nr:tripartite tricarboxylate transporter TctB family protein [Burkholderiaceae bacterium]